MRTTIDLSPLWRSSIGFDRMLDLLDEVTHFEPADHYPPYDIEKTGENAYRITLAVAGFTLEELAVAAQPNLLVISGKKADSESGQFLHRGIAARSFERQFKLADFVKVVGASLDQGLLMIDLVREVPEALKPRRIAIAARAEPKALETRQAA